MEHPCHLHNHPRTPPSIQEFESFSTPTPSLRRRSLRQGASWKATFYHITLPLTRPSLLASTIYSFVSAMQTLGAIIFIISPGTKLLSIEIFEATLRNELGKAAALS